MAVAKKYVTPWGSLKDNFLRSFYGERCTMVCALEKELSDLRLSLAQAKRARDGARAEMTRRGMT